jgi:hypothetical protein
METEVNLEDTPFINDLRNDLNEYHKGRFILITGDPGESKSMTAARLLEKTCDRFDVDAVAMGKASEFLKLLKKARMGELKHGDGILFDEAGAGIPARAWQTESNQLISITFQVIRKLGLLVVMTVPAKRMIDIHGQILMKYYGRAHYIDYKAKRSHFSFYKISYDDWDQDFKTALKRRLLKDEEGTPVNRWEMALPTRIDLEEYEKRKDALMDWLFERGDRVYTRLEEAESGMQEKVTKRDLLFPPTWKLVHEEHWPIKKACDFQGFSEREYHRLAKTYAQT